jgi:hypothetical protein
VPRGRAARGGDHQEVGPARQRFERRLESVVHAVLRLAAEVAHLHVESDRTPGDDPADAAHADDAQALAADARGQRIRALGPFAAPHEAVRGADLSRGVHQQRERGVGHAVVEHVGRVADRDAARAGGLQVELVGPTPKLEITRRFGSAASIAASTPIAARVVIATNSPPCFAR